MWVDAHAHLFDYTDAQLLSVLEEARKARVGVVVSTATSAENAQVAVRQAVMHDMLLAAVGVSPFDVEQAPSSWADDLAALCASDKVVAVGEIGIDATNPTYPSLTRQLPLFELQLDVARQRGLPAVIHSRGIEERAAAVCRKTGVERAVFHCFTGTREALHAVIDSGYYVSLSGIVTFKTFGLRDYIREIPLDRLLIETDCPYLAPVPHRGKSNQPAWVRYVGEEVARLYGIPAAELERKIENNFTTLFRTKAASNPP